MEGLVLLGDSREVLRGFDESTFDAMVTDPPSGISFRGAEWDSFDNLGQFEDFLVEVLTEAYRVLKPGAHILVWSLPRTSYRTGMAIERSGFVLRDGLVGLRDRSGDILAFLESLSEEQAELLHRVAPTDNWMLHVFGQGMPKGLNIKRVLSERGTPEAEVWEGWNTSLRPGVEIWWLARKPLTEKSVVDQVLATGTGAINVDACRISGDMSELISPGTGKPRSGVGTHYSGEGSFGGSFANPPNQLGRWPTNVLLEHGVGCRLIEKSDKGVEDWKCTQSCPILRLNEQSGVRKSGNAARSGLSQKKVTTGFFANESGTSVLCYGDSGGASRFFNTFEADPFYYAAKARFGEKESEHPTVKPQKLMRHLVRLITPSGGRVLDPFAGSGSTIVAALGEGLNGVGIEKKDTFYQIASKRVQEALEREQSTLAAQEDFDFMMGLESD